MFASVDFSLACKTHIDSKTHRYGIRMVPVDVLTLPYKAIDNNRCSDPLFRKSKFICRPAISDLEKQLAEQSNRFLNLQEMVGDLASKHAYNPDEDYAEVEAKLREHLESFLETARSFNTIYTKVGLALAFILLFKACAT
ncbi:hypothetical protein RHGRI_019466 [Rhododendron griersonianum]|uniref:Uncharacterized protein n=1 Tax=Rhododendron griersonianum TaxID=479676 RepID=A0AAV6JK37_9ERIC|nr:hypothetical protein RHGRI_019466 [Rhododendron griersonianum]